MTSRRIARQLILAAVAVLPAVAAAQVGSSAPPPSVRQELEEGRAAWFLNGASALKLNYEQQQVVLSAGQLVRAKSSVVARTRRKLLVLLADGIASGTFDDAKINAGLQEIIAAAKDREPAVVQALIQLHEGLTPEQCKLVVSTIQQGLATTTASFKNEQDQIRQRVASITDQVGLTPDQNKQIKSEIIDGFSAYAPELKEEVAARQKQMDAICKEFTNLYYRPSEASITAGPQLAEKTRRLIALFRKLTAILTPAQRTRVAAIVRERNNLDPSDDGS
jgi:Spy/CpxP family protein refolding chaperone